jgi:large subunit ribosomal protein L5
MQQVKEKSTKAFDSLKGSLKLENVMETPRLVKVVVSAGVGSVKDKKRLELIVDRLTRITGQKPSPRPAKKAIATFKTRIGDIVGYQVTLRGARMIGFLDKFLNVALPRTKDFRGISASTIDNIGNLTIGIKENSIFPETADEDLKDVFGIAVTVVTTAKTKERAREYLAYLGFPFKKDEKNDKK